MDFNQQSTDRNYCRLSPQRPTLPKALIAKGITFIGAVAAALSCHLAVASPSFDCAKAHSAVAKAICASPKLSHLDSEMASTYRAMRQALSPRDAAALLVQQRAWLSGRRHCLREGGSTSTTVASCLILEYRKHLSVWKASFKRQFTWMGGSKRLNRNGVYGIREVPASRNAPGARENAVSWTDGSHNFWLFGGFGHASTKTMMGLGDLNDLWKYDPSTGEWTWESGSDAKNAGGVYGHERSPAVNNTPGARSDAVSWTDTHGNLWLFGGYCIGGSSEKRGDYNDLWKYNPSTGEWTWESGSDKEDVQGVYGSKGMPTAANTPGARFGTVAWTDVQGNLWLFGGWGYDSVGRFGGLNDLWKFSPSTDEWTWESGSDLVGAKSVYGTRGQPARSNTPGAPRVGDGAVAWTSENDNFWLFVGNEMWKYTPSNGEWTWEGGSGTKGRKRSYGKKGKPAVTNTPGVRYGAVAWTGAGGDLWLFGGKVSNTDPDGSGDLNDLWKYTPSSGEWTWEGGSDREGVASVYGKKGWPAPTNVLGAREGAVAWTDASGKAWIFGGGGNWGPSFNGLWKSSYVYLNSPSFDCAKVSSPVEKLICHNSELAKVDSVLTRTYRQALRISQSPIELRNEEQIWLLNRETACGIPASGPLPATLSAGQATECLMRQYQKRIRILAALTRPSLVACGRRSTAVDQIVCQDPALLASYRSLQRRFAALLKGTVDKIRRTELRNGQRAWQKWVIGKFDGFGTSNPALLDRLSRQVHGAVSFRLAQLRVLELPKPTDPLPVKAPAGWWGIDLAGALPHHEFQKRKFAIFGEYVDSDGVLGVEIYAHKPPFDNTFINLFNGHKSSGDPPKGFTRLNGIRYLLNGLPLSGGLMLTGEDANCPGPVRMPVNYRFAGSYVAYPGYDVFERLRKPHTFHYGDFPRCASSSPTWTADFRTLNTQFLGWTPDGTLIAIIGQRYVVRLRPDFTSPFLKGRSDLVVVPEAAVDRLSDADGGPSGPVVLRAVNTLINNAVKAQMHR